MKFNKKLSNFFLSLAEFYEDPMDHVRKFAYPILIRHRSDVTDTINSIEAGWIRGGDLYKKVVESNGKNLETPIKKVGEIPYNERIKTVYGEEQPFFEEYRKCNCKSPLEGCSNCPKEEIV